MNNMLQNVLNTSDKFGNSMNKSTVNSIYEHDLGDNVSIKIAVQSGLCNVTEYLSSLRAANLSRGNTSLLRWVNSNQDIILEFNEKYKDQKYVAYNPKTSVVDSYNIESHRNVGVTNAILYLHKELMVFFVQWSSKKHVLDFAGHVFGAKREFLRDAGASMYNEISWSLSKLTHQGYSCDELSPVFSNKMSKLVFGFNDVVNQWESADQEQLLLRLGLMIRYKTLIEAGQITSFDELKDEMNKLGKTMWKYWNGSSGKRSLKGDQLKIANIGK